MRRMRPSACACPSRPIASGMCICRISSPASCMATASTAPTNPAAGMRFNPAKLLVDPYAKALSRAIEWNDTMFGYPVGDANADLSFDERDSAPFMPRCVVTDAAFDWGDDRPAMHATAQLNHLRAAREGLHQATS